MATIRRKRKGWQVLIRKKGHPHTAKTFASHSMASKDAQESEANIEKGLFADLAEANQTLLRDTLQRYKDEVTVSKKGARQEGSKINKLMRHKICDYSLARLTPNKIAKFKNDLAGTAAPATVNKYLSLISVAVNTAQNEWGIHLPVNPCSKVKRMKELDVDFKKKIIQAKADHQIAHMDLDLQVHSGEVDEAKIRAAGAKIVASKTNKIMAMIDAKIQLLNLLTAEQRQKMAKMH